MVKFQVIPSMDVGLISTRFRIKCCLRLPSNIFLSERQYNLVFFLPYLEYATYYSVYCLTTMLMDVIEIRENHLSTGLQDFTNFWCVISFCCFPFPKIRYNTNKIITLISNLQNGGIISLAVIAKKYHVSSEGTTELYAELTMSSQRGQPSAKC